MSEQESGSGRASDRRAAPRTRTGGALRAQLALEAEVLTLSARGMMVRLGFSPPAGSRQAFTISIGSDVLDLVGVVRNIEPIGDPESAFRVGVEFDEPHARAQQVLERFVAERLAIQ